MTLNPAKAEAVIFEWTGKKDYSQHIHTFHVYLESGHSLNGEVNDDGKNKILNAINYVQQAELTMNPEKLLEQLESTANFMRGMCFDPRIPNDTKEALQERAQAIDEVVQKHLDV